MNTKFGQILDLFSAAEIENITRVLSVVPDQHYGRHGTLNNGFTQQDGIFGVIKSIVIDRINSVCPRPIDKVTVGMQLITSNPYGVHTDYPGKGDAGPGTGYLVPLWTKPITEEKSFTVIFNEGCTFSAKLADYVSSGVPASAHSSEYLWDHIPHNVSYDHFKYLSVGMIAYWHPGSLIYWDRTLFHASDDFSKKGIQQKSALVIFSADDS